MNKEEIVKEVIECIGSLKKLGKDQDYIVSVFEDRIIDLNDPKLSCYFASNIKDANIEAHKNVVINSNNPKYIFEFTNQFAKKTDIEPLRNAIIKNGSGEYNYCFSVITLEEINRLMHLKSNKENDEKLVKEYENIQRHADVIAKSNDELYNFNFLDMLFDSYDREEYFENINVEKNKKVVVDGKNLEHNFSLADHHQIGCYDAEEHVNVIVESKNLEYNYKGASRLPGKYADKFLQVIIDSKDLEYNYKCAKHLPRANVLAHGEVIIDSKDINYNKLFVKSIEGCDRKAHLKIINEQELIEVENHLNELLGAPKVKKYTNK